MAEALFIVFEGIDGAGSTTQTQLLCAYLAEKGVDVVATREPGGTPLAERIRQLVLDPDLGEMHFSTELFLYAASRAQHVHELIRPALEAGTPVVCDRFTASTLAYQGYGRGLDGDLVEQVAALATRGIDPDISIVLDISPQEALKRRAARQQAEDRLEAAGAQLQQRVAQGYRRIAAKDPQKYALLDASLSADRVAEQVRQVLLQRWPGFPYK